MGKYLIILVTLVCCWLPADEHGVFRWSAKVAPAKNNSYKTVVQCEIAAGSYLSSESVKVEVSFADKSKTVIKSPPAKPGKDGSLIYPAGICRWVMFSAKEPLSVTADFQGCTGDTCLMPETLTVWSKKNNPSLEPSNNPSLVKNIPSVSSKKPSEVPSLAENSPSKLFASLEKFTVAGKVSGLLDSKEFSAFLSREKTNAATADSPVEESPAMGFWAVLLLIVLGGLGLNLTPCVLPMIPINLAIIGADAGSAGKIRGFRRGAAYGLGIALSYGVLGMLAALTGSRFGELNSSSIFNWVIAAVFLALALGMFGVYELDLSGLANLFRRKNPGKSKGLPPEITAFGLGIAAALLAGACVAPVVITVILLAARLYSEGNVWGLFLPFALGAAMALPWPLLGAGLSILPKPGMWMVRVKQIFGVLILIMACYYGYLGWSLRSGAFDQSKAVAALAVELDKAAKQKEAVLLDCWATWCKNCKAMDKLLESKEGKTILKNAGVKLIRFQAEKLNDPQVKAFMDKFQLPGLPSLILLKSK